MTEPTPINRIPLGCKDCKIAIDCENVSAFYRPPCCPSSDTNADRTNFEYIAVMRDLRDFAAKEDLDIDKAARLRQRCRSYTTGFV
jgi:hypothetical protein